jgi:PKD repeat protein
VTGTKTLNIGTVTPPPGGLAANFTVTPASPNPGQAASFDAGSSTGGPTIFQWTFGDGQTASSTTATVSHTFQAAGNYSVKLEVSKPDVSCPFGLCSASTTKTVTVAGGPPPVVASFVSPACIADFAGVRCQGDVGQAITLTSTTANATSHFWSFGDGQTASGVQVSHTWTGSGNYTVQLTVSDGRSTNSVSRTFLIAGPPPVVGKKASILPLIAQTRGALVQSSDLYLLNPATSAIDVTLTFLRRGSPEATPPKVTKTIQPGATLYVADVLREMFNRENIAGFVTVTVDTGNDEPIITSFNTTVLNGSEFGQTIPGSSLSTTGSAAGTPTVQVQSLVGLNENAERLAYFGVSNPTQDEASFTVKFIDNDGKQIGALHDFAVAPRGQRQFQPKDIREVFGVNNQDDYRVEIQSTNPQLFPFGSNLRLGSSDPSFVGANSASAAKVYLLGVLSTPGINHTLWQSDVVIANTANEVVLTDMTFTGAGSATQPTQPVHLTLQPGETRRLTDTINQTWGIHNTVGVLTLESNALGRVYPTVQGESYENTRPTKRFGQSLPAVTDAQAAGAGASQFLAGLRQDAKNRSTLWIFNPGSQMAQYDVVYLNLGGQELGRIKDVFLPAGKMQQLSPAQHKLPAAGVVDGFTVQVVVKGGKILSAAQVVKNATNDPAYIQGVTR